MRQVALAVIPALLIFPVVLIAEWPTSPDSPINVTWGGTSFDATGDNKGGAYIVSGWGPIYCVRLDSSGNMPWSNQTLDYVGNEAWPYGVTTSSDDGLLVSYHDHTWAGGGTAYTDILIQKFDSNGNKLWGTGLVINPPNSSGGHPNGETMQSMIAATSDGGAYVAWTDMRGNYSVRDMYVQRVTSTGEFLWGDYGFWVADTVENIKKLFVNESNELTIVYNTKDLSWNRFHYIQSFTESGLEYYTPGGFELPTPPGGKYLVDNLGNLFYRYGLDHIVRFNTNALPTLEWYDTIIESPGDTYIKRIIPLDSGKVAIPIYDVGIDTNRIYLQILDSEGINTLDHPGILVSEVPINYSVEFAQSNTGFICVLAGQNQVSFKANSVGGLDWGDVMLFNNSVSIYPWPTAISDGSGGAIYIFDNNYRIWATKVSAEGVLGGTSSLGPVSQIPKKIDMKIFPNPFNNDITIEYDTAGDGIVELKVFNILGQQVNQRLLGSVPTGKQTITWNNAMGSKSTLPSGIYTVELILDNLSSQKQVTYLK